MKALKLKQLCYRCVSCIFMPKYAEFENKGKKNMFYANLYWETLRELKCVLQKTKFINTHYSYTEPFNILLVKDSRTEVDINSYKYIYMYSAS